ncbi:hypothetical protein MOBT1_001095 [Malassezia obtusa]|uniref:Uncharacterized protein n=1 Tax=Malassezia obtusa TaxID=76774 RepID=A0AAF0E3C6_9BASI|nr:hypothetical protein MOBT1_001095 [Malassezia obtusa]
MTADAIGTSDPEEATGVGSDGGDDGRARLRAWRVKRARVEPGAPRRRAAQAPEPRAAAHSAAQGAAPPPARPAPMRHNLRERKPAQIHPYTVEALRYRRELYRNDWQDAVVSQREWRWARRQEEAEEADGEASLDEGSDQDTESSADEGRSPSLRASSVPDDVGPDAPAAADAAAGALEPASARSTPDAAPEDRARRAPRSPRTPHTPPSSDDSTDYERRFRILKRMMPAHMARACIDDLRAMRHGHAYDDSDASPPPAPSSPEAPASTSPLRPGESRRRRGAHTDAHAPLLSDAESESASEAAPASPPLVDADVRRWYAPRSPSPPAVREADAVDRMLTRTSGARGFGQRTGRAPRRTASKARGVRPARDRETEWLWAPAGARRRRSEAPTPDSDADSDARDARAPRAERPRRPAGTSVVYLSGDAERVRGVPTSRGDLRSYARLPYIPGAARAETIDVGDHAALVGVPMAPPPMAPKAQATADTPELHAELQELLTFDTLAHVSLDFRLRAPAAGVRFAPTTAIARGQLHALLHTERDVRRGEAPVCHVLGATLRAWLGVAELEQVVPAQLDALWDTLREADAEQEDAALPALFLGEWLAWHAQRPLALGDLDARAAHGVCLDTADDAVESLAARVVDLVYTALERGAPARGAARVRRALLWFRVQMAFRVHVLAPAPGTEGAVLEAAQPLMVHLLARGVHRSLAAVAAAPPGGVDDEGAELWIGLVHVLARVGADAFYDVLDAALDDWHAAAPASAVVWAERVWYVVLATCVLARFGAAAGVARSASAAPAGWALVARTLSLRLRFDARVEGAAPHALLRRRDAYIRVVVARCVLLADEYAWPLGDAEGVLGRLFDVFDAHRLADLPTETDHDFAPFLRRYDAGLLGAAPHGPAYQVFLQLLGRAGTQLVRAGDARRAARLFSRMTPVRVMPFTAANVPTSAERALLFNHYSLVMLFLYVVPSGAVQRLRQIRSFLEFAAADRVSQVTCVRAVVYCGTLFRHHSLPLAPVVAWFVEVCRAAAAEVRAAPAAADAPADRRAAHRQREAARVLHGVVRGVQHVVQHAALGAAPPRYPPPELLHAAWTDELLGLDAATDAEVVQGLGARAGADAGDDEFDDAFLSDPRLAALLGEPEPAPAAAAAWDAGADRAVAHALHTRISPALFARLAQPWDVAPARAACAAHAEVEALVAHAERDAHHAQLVACWAACAQVLVQAEVRTWRSYLTLGAESWKRLSDGVQKREVALQLALELARLDAAAFREEAWEVVGVWFQSIAAPHVTRQGALTAQLQAVDPGGVFRGVPWAAPPEDAARDTASAAAFAAARTRVLDAVLHNLDGGAGGALSACRRC